ncbi:MAG: TIGR02391 family protein [Mycoplasmataceae bacterium]|jgi:uncharacterized protein (TIGR02391 family)|nr:TIGR02391 family protein [Mycoplasmataceae bacterium]
MKKTLEKLINDTEIDHLEEGVFNKIIQNIKILVPEYTLLHYRYLQSDIKTAAEEYYKKGDYFAAVQEAFKKYKDKVIEKTNLDDLSDKSIMDKAFGINKLLSVSKKYKNKGFKFTKHTLENIESGQASLSVGMVQCCRNVINHEQIVKLKESGLFVEKDCLDFLSLLSYLFNKLNQSTKNKFR